MRGEPCSVGCSECGWTYESEDEQDVKAEAQDHHWIEHGDGEIEWLPVA